MNFFENRTYLGKKQLPEVGDHKRVYLTPHGAFPTLETLAKLLDKSWVALWKRCNSNSKKFSEWLMVENPPEALIELAVINQNNAFVELYATEDHCTLCNHIDDMIFADNCWLLEVDHDHSDTDLSDVGDVTFSYSFGGEDYTVTYKAWTNGERPHKTKEENDG